MLRPEQMSKVSVTGSKRVMDEVIETVHEMHLLDVTDYDGSWESFEPGNPVEGAEAASEKLVTVRSIESILDVDDEDAGPTRIVTEDALEDELEEVRQRVNELDDRRDELRGELREVREEIDAVDPFAALGIDLDLLSGYDSLQVAVGEGRADAVEAALADADGVDEYQVFSGGGVVAAFAYPTDDADGDVLQDALVGVNISLLEVPDAEGRPEEYVRELEHREQQLHSRLTTVEDELEGVKLDAAGFLLAAEEKLSIDVQKTEAPLSFATTRNAFVAEGWIPTDRYGEFADELAETVGDHVEVEELERARFTAHDHSEVREEVPSGGAGGPDEQPVATADGGDGEARADGGGHVTMRDDSPPVVQQNPDVAKPFEVLVQAVNRPKYSEFDPTVFIFLTFPAFFGFMIGDVGYGLLYTLIGYYLYSSFDSPAFKSMGGITIWAGAFTTLFGVLYGELFGLHVITTYFWEGALGLHGPALEKGLSPAGVEWARGWLVVSLLAGIAHLNVGWILDFVENYQLHDAKHAVFESGSWLLMLNGIWVWVFSDVVSGTAPSFLYETFNGHPFALGFSGFSAIVGWAGFAAFAVGAVLLVSEEPVELPEVLNVFVNVLSYTRLAAVLLAKAGMAFTVNLLFFGVYVDDHGGWHFGLGGMPDADAVAALGAGETLSYHGYEVTEIMFGGLAHGGAATLLVGLLVLVVGHALVLALGVTSAGLQAVRLEYVEFFNKFYEGGGREYEPFGYDRTYTTED
jgi:V/A-type H+-transporting ATPase subunit I